MYYFWDASFPKMWPYRGASRLPPALGEWRLHPLLPHFQEPRKPRTFILMPVLILGRTGLPRPFKRWQNCSLEGSIRPQAIKRHQSALPPYMKGDTEITIDSMTSAAAFHTMQTVRVRRIRSTLRPRHADTKIWCPIHPFPSH